MRKVIALGLVLAFALAIVVLIPRKPVPEPSKSSSDVCQAYQAWKDAAKDFAPSMDAYCK